MVFGWLRKRRRRKLLKRPFPEAWEQRLRTNVACFNRLSEDEQATVRDYVQVFAAEKNWEGCGGLVMTDEVKVTVAAQVGILVLGFQEQYFHRVRSILVYPAAYVAPDQSITKGGLVLIGKSSREGEAWYRGPVVLSWSDVLAGGTDDSNGDNLVFHEFAHQLDMLAGRSANGVPPLASRDQMKRWDEVIPPEYQRLLRDCEYGRPTLLDCYGTTNPAEFFAVSTECFFELPAEMRTRHPELYGVLRDFYRQDPAARLAFRPAGSVES